MEVTEVIIAATITGFIGAVFKVIAHRFTNRRRPSADDQGDNKGSS
ncbi:hypothetical protein ACIBCC_29945 [Streptomyces griseus]